LHQAVSGELTTKINQLPPDQQTKLRQLYPSLGVPDGELPATGLESAHELLSPIASPASALKQDNIVKIPSGISDQVLFDQSISSQLPDSSQLAQYTQHPDSLLEQRAVGYLQEKAAAEGMELNRLQTDENTLQEQLFSPEELKEFGGLDPRTAPQQLGSPEALSQKAQDKATQVATDYLAEQQKQLTAARNKLSRLKQRYPRVKSVQELKKLPYLKRHPLRDTRWQERIVYGLQWQLGSHQEDAQDEARRYRIDLGPRLSYQLTDQWELGLYGQARITLGKRVGWASYHHDPVWGGGAFVSYQIRKGFFAQVAYERLSVEVVDAALVGFEPEARTRELVPGLRLGLGKCYTIHKKLQGYSLIEYNLTDTPLAPYRKQLQVKMGVRF
jgi:hypothetical protein